MKGNAVWIAQIGKVRNHARKPPALLVKPVQNVDRSLRVVRKIVHRSYKNPPVRRSSHKPHALQSLRRRDTNPAAALRHPQRKRRLPVAAASLLRDWVLRQEHRAPTNQSSSIVCGDRDGQPDRKTQQYRDAQHELVCFFWNFTGGKIRRSKFLSSFSEF